MNLAFQPVPEHIPEWINRVTAAQVWSKKQQLLLYSRPQTANPGEIPTMLLSKMTARRNDLEDSELVK